MSRLIEVLTDTAIERVRSFQAPLSTRRMPLVVLACWVMSVAAGAFAMVAYSQTPGPAGLPLAHLGVDEQYAPATKPWRLLVAIHPQCPCTLATTAELQRIMSEERQVLSCSVLVFVPADAPSSWTDTASVRQARSTPGIEIVLDRNGRKGSSLGIQTSGGAALYDGQGVLRFHGGITPSRGHEGVNLGAEAIRALVQGRRATVTETPVYGCRITE